MFSKKRPKSKPDRISKFYFVKYWKNLIVPCERAADEVYIEWSDLQILCTGCKVRTTLRGSIICWEWKGLNVPSNVSSIVLGICLLYFNVPERKLGILSRIYLNYSYCCVSHLCAHSNFPQSPKNKIHTDTFFLD